MTKFRWRRNGASTGETGTAPAATSPVEAEPSSSLADLTVIETGTPAERTAQYNAWAERLKEKRERSKQVYATTGGDADADATSATHWSADAVFAESRRLEEAEAWERPDPRRVAELLSVLDLHADASPAEVGDAYRRLAKRHHPDRFAAADAAVQQEHAGRMADINRAYAALKKLDRA